jgi:putative transcriptional regulator
MTTKKLSPIAEGLLETAEGMHRIGVMSDETYRQITVRHLGQEAAAVAEPMSGGEIRALRERERLSQAAFARYLNLTVGYVSQLERGVKQPKGPALALLNVIRRKGLGVML